MDVLVAHGTKMGGTAGIAEAIANRLEARGLVVDAMPAAEVTDVERFDAIVVGSALYSGRWRPECVRLARMIRDRGYPGPVWIFHSGPLGEDADEPQPLPGAVAGVLERLSVEDVITFAGRMPKRPRGFIARLMARNFAGDYRDWDAIARWADDIADVLLADRAASSGD